MTRIIAALALALAGCAPALESAGVDPVTAKIVEARACEALPGRFDDADARTRAAAEIIMALACPARASLMAYSQDDIDYACVMTTAYHSYETDAFDRARGKVCYG